MTNTSSANLMKKISLLLALCSFSLANAQDKEATSTNKENHVKPTFYVGAGLQSNSNFNLNNKLGSAGLPKITNNQAALYVGINLLGKQYNADVELASAYSNTKSNNTKLDYLNTTLLLRLHRNLVNNKSALLSAGANLGLGSSIIHLYANNNSIDLNNLGNTGGVTHLNFYNNMLYAGPSVSLWMLRKAWFPLRLNLGFEFALTRGRWRSEYMQVNNTVGEFGKNRFVVGIAVM